MHPSLADGLCLQLLGLPSESHHLSGLNNRKCVSHGRSQKFEIKVTAGPCSSKGSRGGSLPASPSFSVSLGCQHIPPVSAVTRPSSYKDTGHVGSGASPFQDDLILTNDVSKDPVSK